MNKKIILLSAITALMQPFTYSALVSGGAGAASKLVPTIKVPGFSLPGAAAKPAISVPMVKLTQQQVGTFTDDLSQVGGKQYLPQIQMVWETNPELMYNAQQAVQNADTEARRLYMHQIMELAKQLASKKSATFNLQDAIAHNPQLESLVNTELSDNLFNIGRTLSSVAYQSETPKGFFHLQNDFKELQNTAKDIFIDTNLTPQQAASKIGELINRFFDPIDNTYNTIKMAESAATNAKEETVKKTMNQTKDLLEKTKKLFESTKAILQKTAPVQEKSATYPELKNFVESINAPAASPISEGASSIQTTIPGEIGNAIPMPTEITPFFEKQMGLALQDLTYTAKHLITLKQQTTELGLLPNEIKTLDLERVNIGKNLKVINKLLKEINILSDHPNALNIFKAKQAELSIVIAQISDSLEKLKEEAIQLLPSEQKNILETLQRITKEVLSIEADTRTTLLVLEEAHEAKEVMAQIKQNLDLGEFVVKTAKDLALVQQTTKQLAAILATKAGLLKTDTAPASMLEVFESKLTTYLTTFEELKTISKIEDLGALQAKLKAQEKELLTTLDSLFSKLAWLPTSTTKNKALDAFRKLKSEFLANKKSIDNIFATAGSIQEKHIFVNIKKNELEMGMLTIIDKSKALQMSIKKDIPADRLTSAQSQALSKLDQAIAEELSTLKKIETAQTSLELDQLTNEFFRTKDLSQFSKQPSSIIPFTPGEITIYIPKYEETLKETLKLFGLKMVLGLTATGAVTWFVQKTDKEEEKYDWLPTTKTAIPEIKNIDISSLIKTGISQELQQPKTTAEFIQKSDQIVEETQKLAQIPTADLNKTVHRLEMDIRFLNFRTFKKEAELFWNNFTAAISNAISKATSEFNQYRVTKLEELKDWSEKNIKPLLETKLPQGTKLPKNNEFKSEYEEVIALLKRYIKQYSKQ
jgi:hypothetical protein